MHMNKAEFEAAFAALLLEPGYYLIHFHGKDIALWKKMIVVSSMPNPFRIFIIVN